MFIFVIMSKPGPEGKAVVPEKLAKAIVDVHLDLINPRCCNAKCGVSHCHITDAMTALDEAMKKTDLKQSELQHQVTRWANSHAFGVNVFFSIWYI